MVRRPFSSRLCSYSPRNTAVAPQSPTIPHFDPLCAPRIRRPPPGSSLEWEKEGGRRGPLGFQSGGPITVRFWCGEKSQENGAGNLFVGEKRTGPRMGTGKGGRRVGL